MALREYLTTEVGEDWVDGLITRREAVRRLILLGMTASSASALLAACAAQISPSPRHVLRIGRGLAALAPPPRHRRRRVPRGRRHTGRSDHVPGPDRRAPGFPGQRGHGRPARCS